jgi:hypothetical protein
LLRLSFWALPIHPLRNFGIPFAVFRFAALATSHTRALANSAMIGKSG